jgi:hypothetical protein
MSHPMYTRGEIALCVCMLYFLSLRSASWHAYHAHYLRLHPCTSISTYSSNILGVITPSSRAVNNQDLFAVTDKLIQQESSDLSTLRQRSRLQIQLRKSLVASDRNDQIFGLGQSSKADLCKLVILVTLVISFEELLLYVCLSLKAWAHMA